MSLNIILIVLIVSCSVKMETETYNYGIISEIAKFINNNVPYSPSILIICGSGLGTLAEILTDPITLNYKDIPHFPTSTVEGHAGNLIFGTLANVKVVCMQGRFHYYEGYSLQEVTAPIRALKLVGVKLLIVTNAAGAINSKYQDGDIMLIKDHINLLSFAGVNPLRGPNDPRFGPRFLPMNKAYDRTLIRKAKLILNSLGLKQNTHEGVYAMVGGPTYETLAEMKALKLLGADAVGMSTIPEVIVAKHSGMTVFGFSLITDVVDYDNNSELDHKEVLEAAHSREEQLKEFVLKLVRCIGSNDLQC